MQLGKRPGRKAKLAAPGTTGKGAVGHLSTGRGWTRTQKQPQTIAQGDETGCKEKQPLAWQPRGTHTLTHTRSRVYTLTQVHSHTPPPTHGTLTFLPTCVLTRSHTHAGSNLRKWASVLEVQAPTASPLQEAFLQTLPRDPGCVPNGQHLVACEVSGVGCFLAKPRWPQALGRKQGSQGLGEVGAGVLSN